MMSATERQEQLEHWNTTQAYPKLIEQTARIFDVEMKDIFKDGKTCNLDDATPKEKRTSNWFTICNDTSYLHSQIKSSRMMLRRIDAPKDVKEKHRCRATRAATEMWDTRYKRKECSITVMMPSEMRKHMMRNIPEVDGADWETSEEKRLRITYGFANEVERMGLKDWIKVGGKEMMYASTIETKTPAWAEEQNVQVRKVIAVQPITKKTAWRSYEDVLLYHNNVWLLTHKSYDGGIIAAANKNFERARSLMDQYIKAGVINELDQML